MEYYPSKYSASIHYSEEIIKSWNKATIHYNDEDWECISPPNRINGICIRAVMNTATKVEYYFSDDDDFVMFSLLHGSKFISNI